MEIKDKIIIQGKEFRLSTIGDNSIQMKLQSTLSQQHQGNMNVLHTFEQNYDNTRKDYMKETHNSILSSFVKLFRLNKGDVKKSIDVIESKVQKKNTINAKKVKTFNRQKLEGLEDFLDNNVYDIVILSQEKFYFINQNPKIKRDDITNNLTKLITTFSKNRENIKNLIGDIEVSYASYDSYKIVLYFLKGQSIRLCAIIAEDKNFGQTIKKSENIMMKIKKLDSMEA